MPLSAKLVPSLVDPVQTEKRCGTPPTSLFLLAALVDGMAGKELSSLVGGSLSWTTALQRESAGRFCRTSPASTILAIGPGARLGRA